MRIETDSIARFSNYGRLKIKLTKGRNRISTKRGSSKNETKKMEKERERDRFNKRKIRVLVAISRSERTERRFYVTGTGRYVKALLHSILHSIRNKLERNRGEDRCSSRLATDKSVANSG